MTSRSPTVDHFLGGVEDADGVGQAEVFGGEQVLHAPPSMTTSLTVWPSMTSVSSSRTRTFSAEDVGQVLAHVVGADGKFAVAPVDQDGQAHDARPAEVHERVQGGADGAAGVQDVVDQDNNLVVDAGQRQLRVVRRPGGLVGEVVPEHGDVELADDGGGVHGGIGGGDFLGEPDRKRVAAAGNAQQHQVLGAFVGLEDFMGDTSECTVNVRLVEYNPGRNRCLCDRSQRSSPLSPPHGTELKKEHLPSKITTRAPRARPRQKASSVTPRRRCAVPPGADLCRAHPRH